MNAFADDMFAYGALGLLVFWSVALVSVCARVFLNEKDVNWHVPICGYIDDETILVDEVR